MEFYLSIIKNGIDKIPNARVYLFGSVVEGEISPSDTDAIVSNNVPEK